MKNFLTGFAIFLNCAAFTQGSINMNVASSANTNSATVNFTNASDIGKITQINLNDDEISGTSFWRNDWNKAALFLSSGNVCKLNKAKLNLSTNEIFFLDANNVLKTVDESQVSKIIFFDKNDSAKTLAVFQKLHYDNNSFFQVLNNGNCELLKAIVVSIYKKGYNTSSEKDEYGYNAKPVYYLFNEGKIIKLDALNKEQLSTNINVNEADKNWLAQNRNKLKGESDWVSFLNYYNSRQN